MRKRLYVAFLWHMHQPIYKDLLTGKYHLPWVRLHSTYSYIDVVSMLEDFPGMRCTVNLTPSLIWQLRDITENDDIDDIYLRLSAMDPGGLSDDEKCFLLKNFFSCNPATAIVPIRKYHDLFIRRGETLDEGELMKKINDFNDSDLRDLQVFFNLAWCGFTLKEKNPVVADLIRKGGNFSEDEKSALLRVQNETVASILPLYKKCQDEGKIEISTTPYYHPILPLLCGGKGVQGFDFREDARWHVKHAVKLYREVFGRDPVGMWPAEGGVSPEAIPFFASNKIKWLATDESIVLGSFPGKNVERDDLVFTPLKVRSGLKSVAMFFRDTNLSNAISFKYANMPGREAADDLLKDIMGIREAVRSRKGDHVVSIILDGENPWPYYPDGGKAFLSGIYGSLTSGDRVEPVTFGGFLKKHIITKKIKTLKRGSWIHGDFGKWIGSPQKNRAWEYLQKVRKDVTDSGTADSRVMEELYIAESSDWFWWYDEFGTELNYVFDEIYRMHLMNIYRLMDKEIPGYLEEPIYDRKIQKGDDLLGMMAPPVLDGKITYDFEWISARNFSTRELAMAMVKTDAVINRIAYGIDRENLYLMVSPGENYAGRQDLGLSISVSFGSPVRGTAEIPLRDDEKGTITVWDVEGKNSKQAYFMTFSYDEILEASIPFSQIGAREKDEVNFRINVKKKDELLENWPNVGFFKVMVPDARQAKNDKP